MIHLSDISPEFRYSKVDASIIAKILPHEGTARAIRVFSNEHRALSNYAYWFTLGTLWVSYSGHSDIDLWIRLFSSSRPGREHCLMKPSELQQFSQMPEEFAIYRAHRPDERNWIAYTLDPQKAADFATRRGVKTISEYQIRSAAVLALFLRRDEQEVIVLDRAKPIFRRSYFVHLLPTWNHETP